MSSIYSKAGRSSAAADVWRQRNQDLQQGLPAVTGGIESIFQKKQAGKAALDAALENRDNDTILAFLSQMYLDKNTGKVKQIAGDYANDIESLPASVLEQVDLETTADGSFWTELLSNTSVDQKAIQRFIDKGYLTQWRDQQLVPYVMGLQSSIQQAKGQFYYGQDVTADMQEFSAKLLQDGAEGITADSVSDMLARGLSFAAEDREKWGGSAMDPDMKYDVMNSPEAKSNYIWQLFSILSQDYLRQRMDNEDVQSYTQVQAMAEELFDQTLVPAAAANGVDIRMDRDQYLSEMADPNSGYATKIAKANIEAAAVQKRQAEQVFESIQKTGEVLSNNDRQALIAFCIPGDTAASRQAQTEMNIKVFDYDRQEGMSRMNEEAYIDIQKEDGTSVSVDMSLDSLFAEGNIYSTMVLLSFFAQEESGLVTLPDGRTFLSPYSEAIEKYLLGDDGLSDEEKVYYMNSLITGISHLQEKAIWTDDQIGRQRLLLSDEDFAAFISRLHNGGLIDYDTYNKWISEENPAMAKNKQILADYLSQQLGYLNALSKKNNYKLEDVFTINDYKNFEQYMLNHKGDISEEDIKNFASLLIQQHTDIILADNVTEALKRHNLMSNMANGGPINVSLFDDAYSGDSWSLHKSIMDGNIAIDNSILSETFSMIALMDAGSLNKNLRGIKDTLAERVSGSKGISYEQSEMYIKNTVDLYLFEALLRKSNLTAFNTFSGESCIEVPVEKNGWVEMGYMRGDGVIFIPKFGSVNNLDLFKATPEQINEIKTSGSQFVSPLHFTEDDFFATYSFSMQGAFSLDKLSLREKMGIYNAERNALAEMFTNPAFSSQKESDSYAERFSDLPAYSWMAATGDQAVSDEELLKHEAEINAYIGSIDDPVFNFLKGRGLLPGEQATGLPLSSDCVQLNAILNRRD